MPMMPMLVVLALACVAPSSHGAATFDLNMPPPFSPGSSSEQWSGGGDILAKDAADGASEMQSVATLDTPLVSPSWIPPPNSILSLGPLPSEPHMFVSAAKCTTLGNFRTRSRSPANLNGRILPSCLPYSGIPDSQRLSIFDVAYTQPGSGSGNTLSLFEIQTRAPPPPENNPGTLFPHSLPSNIVESQHKKASEPSRRHSGQNTLSSSRQKQSVLPANTRHRHTLKITDNKPMNEDPDDTVLTVISANPTGDIADDQVKNQKRIEIPNLVVPKHAPIGEIVAMVRQHYDLYSHYENWRLTKRSREIRRSMWHLINCFDHPKHCGKSEQEFHRRHPSFSHNVTHFHGKFCNGTDTCHYERKLKQRAAHKLRNRGSFAIPPLVVPRTPTGEIIYSELLDITRSHHSKYGGIPRSKLTGSSQMLQLAIRHMLHCFDYHCQGDVDTFAQKHTKLMPMHFCHFNCSSFGSECNYAERNRAYIRHLESDKLNYHRKKKRQEPTA